MSDRKHNMRISSVGEMFFDIPPEVTLSVAQVCKITLRIYLQGSLTEYESLQEVLSGRWNNDPLRGNRRGGKARLPLRRDVTLRILPDWREKFRDAASDAGESIHHWAELTIAAALRGDFEVDHSRDLDMLLNRQRNARKFHLHLGRDVYAAIESEARRGGHSHSRRHSPINAWTLRVLLSAVG